MMMNYQNPQLKCMLDALTMPLGTVQSKRFSIADITKNLPRSSASPQTNRPALTAGVGASQG